MIADVKVGRPRLSDTVQRRTIECSATPQFLRSLLKDETGGEVIEYAIVAGLISIAAIAVIGSFGVKVLARWNSVNSSM